MKDIRIEDDLLISNGDFVVEDATNQHVTSNLKAYIGDFYQYPELGAGITARLIGNNTDPVKIKRMITKYLSKDNFRVSRIEVKESGIFVNAKHKSEL